MDIERLKELRKALNAENWNAKTMIEVIAIIDEAIARHDNFVKHLRAAIAALQEYQPMVRKDRIVEEVQEAIGDLLDMKEHWCADSTDNDAISIDLAITALQAYQPKKPCERASLVASGSVYQVLTCSNCGAVLDEIKFTEPPKGE